MVDEFNLTDEEQAERLKSGQLRIYNRMYWAITDLEKAKL
jgi:restriction endonuclease Mrr